MCDQNITYQNVCLSSTSVALILNCRVKMSGPPWYGMPSSSGQATSNSRVSPAWYGAAPGIVRSLIPSQPRSQLLISSEERRARNDLADQVRLSVQFSPSPVFHSRDHAFQYRIESMLNLLDEDGAPSFSRDLLKFCYKRLPNI